MKRIFIFLAAAALTLFATVTPCYAKDAPAVSAQSAILVDLEGGVTLFEKNADKPMGPASTTKIMTALTVLRYASPDDTVTVSPLAVGTEGSSVYLCEGERLTVEQLLYALLLSSANDAAVALAVHVSRDVNKFVGKMNDYAAELGLKNTHFTNPHGLSHEEHYTTARDLATIAREAMKNKLLARIFSTYRTTIPFNGEPDKRLLINHNKLLRSYEGAIGVKTGFTKATGRTLVSAAKRDGLSLIAVTLNAPDDWKDHSSMLNYGFECFERREFYGVGEFEYLMPAVGGTSESIILTNSLPISATLPKGKNNAEITVYSTHRFVFAPVETGEILGYVELSVCGQILCSPLTVKSGTVSKKAKASLLDFLGDILNKGN